MGRAPCCDKANVKKGPWSPEEDAKLKEYIEKNGTGGKWIALPQKAALKRCGKSCRLRWLNYLRPNIKHGKFSDDEDRIICTLYANIGSRWSIIAAQLPGRTDNDIKNYWNTKLKKKLMGMNNINTVQSRLVPQQATTTNFSSLLQASSSLPSSPSPPVSSSSSSPYNNTYYNSIVRPFTEPVVSFSSSPLSSNNNSLITMQKSFLSSSGGSCNNQINNHGKEDGEQMGYDQSYFCNTGVEESQQRLMGSNGLWGENMLDYGLEEIKQLISSTSSRNNNINNHNFLFDYEIKAEEGVLY